MPMLQSKGFEFHAPFEMRHNSDRIPSHSASNRSAELTVYHWDHRKGAWYLRPSMLDLVAFIGYASPWYTRRRFDPCMSGRIRKKNGRKVLDLGELLPLCSIDVTP